VLTDLEAMAEKTGALEIIFSAPVWPRLDELEEHGRKLHSKIYNDAKPYSLNIARGEWRLAFDILGGWTPLVNKLINNVKINEHPPSEKMLQVYLHYADALGVGKLS